MNLTECKQYEQNWQFGFQNKEGFVKNNPSIHQT